MSSTQPVPIPEIRTERLLLPAVQPSDLDDCYERIFADPLRWLP